MFHSCVRLEESLLCPQRAERAQRTDKDCPHPPAAFVKCATVGATGELVCLIFLPLFVPLRCWQGSAVLLIKVMRVTPVPHG